MPTRDLEPLLRSQPLFASLDDDQYARLARALRVVPLAARQMLFQRGDPARHWYVVLDGSLKLSIQAPNGQEKIVERIGPGQSFGEALMFMEAPAYPLAAIALEESSVLAVPNSEMVALLRESPEACFRMMADLSRRLHGLVREVEEVTLASARLRLVNFLVALAAEAGGGGEAGGADAGERAPAPSRREGPAEVLLAEPKHVLASRLAMKPETLSRTFRALTEEGLLAVDGRRIRITDVARLRDSA